MSQLTNLDPTVEFDADLGIVDTNSVKIGNVFGPSRTVTDISSQDGDPLLTNGDRLTVPDGSGTGDRAATYLGDATITTASVDLNALVASLSIQLNPIEGELIQYDNGDLGFLSEDPLSDARLGVTAELTVLGVTTTFTGDLSDLDAFVRGTPTDRRFVRRRLDLGQFVLDTAAVTVEVDTNGTLVVCFAAGTRILTDTGERAIETLSVGDRVFTRDRNMQTIRWIGRRALSSRVLRANPNLVPIRIKAGAFGDGLPQADLVVSPQHRILIGSRIAERMFDAHEILVAAKQLLDLDGVEVATDLDTVEYLHILLDRHEVIFAHGIGTESLYTGPQALKSLTIDARIELLSLFPDLILQARDTPSARPLAPGRKARRLVERHLKNHRPSCRVGP